MYSNLAVGLYRTGDEVGGRNVYDQMKPAWKGSREFLLAQIIGLVEKVLRSDRIRIVPALFCQDELRRRILLTLNMTRIVQHLWEAIREGNPLLASDFIGPLVARGNG